MKWIITLKRNRARKWFLSVTSGDNGKKIMPTESYDRPVEARNAMVRTARNMPYAAIRVDIDGVVTQLRRAVKTPPATPELRDMQRVAADLMRAAPAAP